MAQSLTSRLSTNWSKVRNNITHRLQRAATVLTSRPYTWLENHINHNRTRNAQRSEYRKMAEQFNASLKTCYKYNKISKKEMKMAKKQWKEAMEKVKEEDKRREKRRREEVSVSEHRK